MAPILKLLYHCLIPVCQALCPCQVLYQCQAPCWMSEAGIIPIYICKQWSGRNGLSLQGSIASNKVKTQLQEMGRQGGENKSKHQVSPHWLEFTSGNWLTWSCKSQVRSWQAGDLREWESSSSPKARGSVESLDRRNRGSSSRLSGEKDSYSWKGQPFCSS